MGSPVIILSVQHTGTNSLIDYLKKIFREVHSYNKRTEEPYIMRGLVSFHYMDYNKDFLKTLNGFTIFTPLRDPILSLISCDGDPSRMDTIIRGWEICSELKLDANYVDMSRIKNVNKRPHEYKEEYLKYGIKAVPYEREIERLRKLNPFFEKIGLCVP